MGILNFFRPEWQHSNPEVRKKAVLRLDNSDMSALSSVALNDADPKIRNIAIKKLSDTDALQNVLAKETDLSNKHEAEVRLQELWANILKNFREVPTDKEKEALKLIAGTPFADDLVKSMPNSELRLSLVNLTTRQGTLEYIALKDAKSEIAMTALERIDRENMLDNISKNSRHTEVRQKAAERKKALQKPSKQEAEKNEMLLLFHKRDAIIQQAQRLSDAKDFMTNKPQFDKVLEMASELGMGPAQADLDRVIASYENRRAEEKARIEKENAEALAKETKRKELEGILSQIDRLLEAGAGQNKDAIAELIQKFEEANGDAETPLTGLFKMSVERFNRLTRNDTAESAAEDRTSRDEILAQLSLLADSDDTSKTAEHKVKALVRKWESMPLMEGEDPELQKYNALRSKLSEKFNEKREADEKAFNENVEKLRAIIESVKKIDENGDFRDISQKLRDSYKAWKDVVGDDKFRYKEIWKEYQEATERFKEMQEWESWHNEHDREALLEEMAALESAEPSKDTIVKLRALTSQWKAIGPVSAARVNDFRDKFRGLFEGIMAKCEPFLKEQEEERKKNLEIKEGICEKVKALSTENGENWRDKYKTMQELQEKWKTVGMVPKENVQPLWDRFRAAETAFYSKHREFVKKEDVVREANYQKKIALCEKAETLSDSSDWNSASGEFRKLQEDWKASGPVPRSKSEEIWNRFRTACDAFFARKRAHFEEMDQTKLNNLKAKEALCEKLEAIDFDLNSPESMANVKAIVEEWKTIGMVPKENVDSIWDRYSEILDLFAEKRAAADPEFKKIADEAKQKKEAMISTVSALVESAGSNESSDTVKRLQSEWKSLPRTGTSEKELYQKFRVACDDFFNRRRDQLDIQEQARENNLQNKLRLCEEAERLLESLTEETRREAMNVVKQLRRHWKEIGAVPRKDSDKVWKRFNSACDAIFGNKPEDKQPEA
jgi:hypothetical protein